MVCMCSDCAPGWKVLFTNANDGNNEGIAHETRPYFTAQFHPEAACGPSNTEFMSDTFLDSFTKPNEKIRFPVPKAVDPVAPLLDKLGNSTILATKRLKH